jgi:hypothetical protein
MKTNKLIIGLIIITALAGTVFYSVNRNKQIDNQLVGGTTLKVPSGGTGTTSFTAGECLIGAGTGAIITGACGTGGSSAWGSTTTGNIWYNGGNVGIGTSTPVQSLDVNGNISVSSENKYLYNYKNFLYASTTKNSWYLADSGSTTASGVQNTSVGYQALYRLTAGAANTAMGYQALYSTTDGYQNNSGNNAAFGVGSLYSNTTGYGNQAFGAQSMPNNRTGIQNTAVGYDAMSMSSIGSNNTALGRNALYWDVDGNNNVAVGNRAGYNTLGGYGIFLGNYAGAYELASSSFYLDNQDRLNTTGDKANALLYGVMASTSSMQSLTINASTTINGILGIGTSTFSNSSTTILQMGSSSPGYLQVVLKNGSATASSSGDFVIENNLGTDSKYFLNMGLNSSGFNQPGLWTISGANDGYLYNSDGALSLGSATSSVGGYVNFFTGGTLAGRERMRISNTGLVGIGTTTPDAIFSIATTSSTTILMRIATTTNNNIMIVNQNGYVGINTNSPSYQLQVSGGVLASNLYSSGSSYFASIYPYNSTSDLIFNLRSQNYNYGFKDLSGNQLLTITASSTNGGIVGIGTTTPNAALTIATTSSTMKLMRVATNTNQQIFLINNYGNVGIGSSTPSESLSTYAGIIGSYIKTFSATVASLFNKLTVFTELIIPNGANTIFTNNNGDTAIRNGNLIFNASTNGTSATSTLSASFDKSFWVGSSTPDNRSVTFSSTTASSTWYLWYPTATTTYSTIYCRTDTGTVNLVLSNGVATTTPLLCSSSGVTGATTSGQTSNTFNPRVGVVFQIGSPASSPNGVTVTATFQNIAW